MGETDRAALAARVDHAVLSPSAGKAEVLEAVRRCSALGVRGICVPPRLTATAAGAARGSGVRIVTVIGFPAGTSRPDLLLEEARLALRDGARELDVALPWGWVDDPETVPAAADWARLVVEVAGEVDVKLILEVSEVTDAHLEEAIRQVVVPSGARWLKTGTGVYGHRLERSRIAGIRRFLPNSLRLKVAGGIRDRVAAGAALAAGADIVGTSHTFVILS